MKPKKTCYFFSDAIGSAYYGSRHPMKPMRIVLTHSLILSYDLYKNMAVFKPRYPDPQALSAFHSDSYVNFLSKVTPDTVSNYQSNLSRFNIVDDCPIFDGLWEYCQISAGGSICAAEQLNSGEYDIAINWAGGLHHAKKSEASGFCYINDIVLGILELLKYHPRVLYIDIDIHHGDGVEEAFYTTDRVMTFSLHKYGQYFPGSGCLKDMGVGPGRGYSVNFPLHDGMDDEWYTYIFDKCFENIMQYYRPTAIVLQCGADSIVGDRLGVFNLSLKGHGHCVTKVLSYGVPTMILGGGGYTPRNVARCWAYETSLALNNGPISNEIPLNDYYSYYIPDHQLHLKPHPSMINKNSPEYLQQTLATLIDQLRDLEHAPSVQMSELPQDTSIIAMNTDPTEDNPDERKKMNLMGQDVLKQNEFYDPDEDAERHRTRGFNNYSDPAESSGKMEPVIESAMAPS
ncbi:hypothetical protein PCE1_002051 [Barthelona sp. PCE]